MSEQPAVLEMIKAKLIERFSKEKGAEPKKKGALKGFDSLVKK